jgi:hypothetical protein
MATPNFDYLKKLDVNEESTAEFTFDRIWGEPSITCRPMAECNTSYMNERVRIAVERAKADEAKPKKTRKERQEQLIDLERIKEDRQLDIQLIATTCAVGWGTPPRDTDGREVEFSPANCRAFLEALPDYEVDIFRAWAENIHNFIDRAAAKPAWADSLGNSSPTVSDGS